MAPITPRRLNVGRVSITSSLLVFLDPILTPADLNAGSFRGQQRYYVYA